MIWNTWTSPRITLTKLAVCLIAFAGPTGAEGKRASLVGRRLLDRFIPACAVLRGCGEPSIPTAAAMSGNGSGARARRDGGLISAERHVALRQLGSIPGEGHRGKGRTEAGAVSRADA
jgi:hypothetical protein